LSFAPPHPAALQAIDSANGASGRASQREFFVVLMARENRTWWAFAQAAECKGRAKA
jgi:hypothetical protein